MTGILHTARISTVKVIASGQIVSKDVEWRSEDHRFDSCQGIRFFFSL